ncbi:MAG TPA: hypothetical protein VGZ02_01650 [Candidatus Baltobacteraceae bacterium]|jgi:hypothetical protein|nr:hypothetical protein [Candidatus Baltobacteraceae bacterium]
MTQNVLILVVSALVCAYDVYIAVRSGGHNIFAWCLAAVMAIVAIFTLRQVVRPNS